MIWSLFYSLSLSVCSTFATQFLKNVPPLTATAANYYLRAAFVSHLETGYFLTFALREVSSSETGPARVQVAANSNTGPEGVHYFTTTF